MGISGLLPLLKSVSNPIHIKEWKGKTVAVDAYVRFLSASSHRTLSGADISHTLAGLAA